MKIPAAKRIRIISDIGRLETKHCQECPINQHLNSYGYEHCHNKCQVGKEIKQLGIDLLGGNTLKVKSRRSNCGRKKLKVDKNLIITMYNNGSSFEEIEKASGIKHNAIRKRLKDWGVYKHYLKDTYIEIDKEKAITLYHKGYTMDEISKQFNVSTTFISNRLRKWGVKTRPRGVSKCQK